MVTASNSLSSSSSSSSSVLPSTSPSPLPVSSLDSVDILKYIHKYSAYDAGKLEDLGTLLQRKRIYGSTTVSILVSELLETLLALPYTSLTVYDILTLLSHVGEYLLASAVSLSATDSSIYGSTWIIIGVIRRASYLIQETTVKRNASVFHQSSLPSAGSSSSLSSSVPSTPTPTLLTKGSQTHGLSNKNASASSISANAILDSLRGKLHELVEKENTTVPNLSLPLPSSSSSSSSSSNPLFPSSLPSSLRTLFLDPSASSIASYTLFATIPWTKALASSILDGISEIAGECANVSSSLQETILDQIRPGESILLVGGYSRTVLNYIQEAGKKRMFEVFICEGNSIHGLRGQEMALQLTTTTETTTKSTVPSTTLIPESTIYSILPRITKVFVSSPAIFGGTGDCICTSGTLGILLTVSHARKPILVLNSVMKILPIQYTELPGYDNEGNKQTILPYLEYNELSSSSSSSSSSSTTVDMYAPLWDYIPANLITYYITTSGIHLPNQIPRIANELYGTHY